MKVYTKTGDKGTSQLYNGERRGKDDAVFEALGTTDELNSMVGIAREYCLQIPDFQESDAATVNLPLELESIMSRLFDVGSAVATPLDTTRSANKLQRTAFEMNNVTALEELIDTMDKELPPLTNFILPSGGLASSHLHAARTFARRAERRIVPLVSSGHVDSAVGIYMNRLSDFFFVAARYSALKSGATETVYKKQLSTDTSA